MTSPTRWCWLVLLLFGYRPVDAAPMVHRFDFAEPHMGTVWSITCYGADRSAVTGAVAHAFRRIDELERIMTDYDPESELLRLCSATPREWHEVSPDLFRVLELCGQMARQSSGCFDPTVGPLVQVWRRARRQRELPEPGRIHAALDVFGWKNVTLHRRRSAVRLGLPGMRLDLGGIAKGYAADAALKVLRDHGLGSALVAASGDLAIGDAPPGEAGWRIRIGDPSGRTNVIGQVLLLRNAGVSTSGDTEQFVEIAGRRFSHIVDPRTGLGLTNRVQATVIAECATRSDALATAVCILGTEAGQRMIERDRKLSSLLLVPKEGGYQQFASRRLARIPRLSR